jgi:hypothetical protein
MKRRSARQHAGARGDRLGDGAAGRDGADRQRQHLVQLDELVQAARLKLDAATLARLDMASAES